MGSLLTQSLKILKDASILQGKEYFSNAIELVNDANEVRTDVMKVAKNSTDTLKNLRRSFNFRGIHDWFYQKDRETADSDDEEYDPGFDTGDEDDTKSTVLDRDAMRAISNRQSNTMIQVGAKQAETTMASTAEIVTTINQRSSELLTSVNNINTTLIGISKKLDAFGAVVQAEKTEQARQSLYDNSGRLSLSSIYNTAKNNGTGLIADVTGYAGMGSLLKGLGPAEVLQALYGFSGIGDKKLKILGDQSVEDVTKKINDSLGEAVQRGLEDLISSKPFKTLFGDLRRGEANHDYREDVVKGYNNKQATFDGYVRTTIIKTIPEYLRIIAKGVTGINYNVGKDGNLTQGTRMGSKISDDDYKAWKRDEEANQKSQAQALWGDIAKAGFKSSSLGWNSRDALFNGVDKDLTRTEMALVANTLNGVLAELIGQRSINRLTPKMLTEDTTLIEQAISYTTRIMKASSSKKVDWRMVVRSALISIASGEDARRFCEGVNRTYKTLHEKRTENAASGGRQADFAGIVNMDQTVAAATAQNKKTLQSQADLNRLDELKRELEKYNKMSQAERLRMSIPEREHRKQIELDIEELQKKLKLSGYGNTYNQSAYGNYLNIAKNGCGPVALADMLNRRGLYNPNGGMNVGSFMAASAMMGNPLTPGNVNNMTLRYASGNNPITLLGSGPEFGTAYGNNHFMNVIGSDGAGNVYVMNPIDGKVHKRSINGVAGSSIVGLYGSGIGDRIKTGFNNFMSKTGDELYDAAKERASSFISEHFNNATEKANEYLNKSLERAQRYGNSDKVSEEDRTQMNLVMSMMETAAEDGDSGPDKQAIMMEISRIKDQKLKARLRAAVSGMIDRQTTSKEKGGLLGKILSAGKGILKNFFAPLIGGIKSVVSGVISKAKSFLKPVIEFFKKQLQKNVGRIKAGAGQFKEGFTEVREGISETVTNVKGAINERTAPVREAIGTKVNAAREFAGEKLGAAREFIGNKASAAKEAIGNKFGNIGNALSNKFGGGNGEGLGSKLGKTLSSKLGGIGKMLSGMGGILAGIAGIVANILMGVEGFRALFSTVTGVVKGIAGSFNGLFKTLNKTLKPVLKIVTKTLSEIVKAVTGVIAPVLTALEPILTTLGDVVSNVLKPIAPIVSFIGKIVGKIASFILKPIEWIANGVKWLSTKFAKGFGKLIHPFSKKKRAQYYKSVGLNDDGDDSEEVEKKKKKDQAYKNLSSDEKHEIAEKYSKLLHPVNKEKRQDVYEKMMSGDITEADAKKMLIKKGLATGLVLAGGGAGVVAYTAVKAAGQIGSKIKSTIHNKLTTGSKDEVANRLAKLMYPLNKTKREEIYDQIMSGKLSIEEAEKMIKRKALDRAANAVILAHGGPMALLAKEGVSRTGQFLIKYFKERDEKVDADNEKRDKKNEENRKEDQKFQLSIFKNGPLKILSGIHSITDAVDFLKGGGMSILGMAEGLGGGIIGGIGRMITAVGELASYLPFVDENNKIALLGQSLLETSDKLSADGSQMLTRGLNLMKLVSTDFGDSNAASLVQTSNAGISASSTKRSSYTSANSKTSSNGYQTFYTSGDIPYTNADINVIGSGDAQSSYGNYLNMARRGCGPVALADAYNRRTGSNISASALATKMASNGAYNPSRGTSVGGYLSAAHSLGMGTRVGGVTMNSLKRATPNNPITLVGSGVEFGTRNGNQHYLNAIGTDHYGGVYVSNPMTGRIQRRSANSIAGSSLMGIYGSGDLSDIASFSDETKEAMKNLLSLNGAFSSLFQTDSTSEVDDMADKQATEDKESKIAKTAQENYSGEDYQNKVIKAMDLFRAENPMRDGETPEEYEKRISDKWSGSSVIRNKYISMVVNDTISDDLKHQYDSFIASSKDYYEPYVVYQKDAQGNIVHDENGNPIVTGGFKHLMESADSEYVKSKQAAMAIKHFSEALTAASAAGAGGGGSASRSGGGNLNSLYAAAAAVFEAAVKNNGGIYATCKDVGPVTLRDGTELPNFRQDCSGLMSATIKAMGYKLGAGGSTGITTYDMYKRDKQDLVLDADGNPSDDWELLPYSKGSLKPGDIVTSYSHMSMYINGPDTTSWSNHGFDGGSGLGNESPGVGIQNSGKAGAAYLDGDPDWQSKLHYTHAGADGLTRILRFKGALDGGGVAADGSSGFAAGGSQGKIKLSKAMEAASPQWKYYPDKLTKGGYWDAAKRAGFTTAQTAMVAAIGIHENGAKKLTGEESLTRVVWDNIGKQYAFGLMNWIPDEKNSRSGANETKFGTTLADQLKYIRDAYFSPTSTYDRAKNVNFNRYYGNAMKEALGYAPHLGQGDRWGPYAETDLAESMGHYVGNALVPYDFNRTTGQARHMRTAVEAYNWMLENGVANGYATGSQSGGGSGSIGAGFDIAAMMGESANNLPDYYKNMLGLVQNSINTNAAASSSYSSSSSFGDYGEYDDYDEGEAEGLSGDTRVYATNAERNKLYNTMTGKYPKSSTAWSNTQLTSKGYGDIYLYMEPSTSSKITCKLKNNSKYSKVTTTGGWYFVYASYSSQYGPLCGWGRSSDFTLTTNVTNKTYLSSTLNDANSSSDVLYNNWKSLSDNYKFYKPTGKDASGNSLNPDYLNHWFTAKGPSTGKYKVNKVIAPADVKHFRSPIYAKVDAPYVTLSQSYDKKISNVNRDVLVSDTQSKTLAQLRKLPGACGDFDYNTSDSGFFIPGNIYGSGDEINSIPPLNNNAFDTLMNYGYDNGGSYTVNYNIQGGINNGTADLTRNELLSYLLSSEFTTRSPRIEKLLNKILDKLDNVNTNRGTSNTPSSSEMYDDEIPDVISALVRG
jgi:hypothetical protein